MKTNLDISRGLPMAEALMTKMINKGMGRGDAHELMRKTSLNAIGKNKSLKEIFLEENKKKKILTEKEINDTLKPENYLGATNNIIDRVIKKLER
jgi:adenylosuccinate lyase